VQSRLINMSQINIILALVPCLFLTSLNAYAGNNLDQLSEKLIQLRGEVEQLNNEIHFMKQEHKQEMSFLWTQKTEAKSEQQRKHKSLTKLQKNLEQKVAENKTRGLSSEALQPEFMSSITDVQTYLETAIPFKKAERIVALLEIQEQVSKGLISVQRGFNKLWAFIEDEIRLTKETGIFQQTIQISNVPHKQLVEVARVGMMKMYFKTASEQFGLLTKNNNSWSFDLVTDPEQKKQIDTLFSSLQKQVRTGLFTLPNQILEEKK